MRFCSVVACTLLALGQTGLCDRQDSHLSLLSGSAASRARALVRTGLERPSSTKRQISLGDGGISIGGANGLKLGGKGKGQGAEAGGNVAGNRTANNNAGLTIGGVQLGADGKSAGTTGNSALDAFLGAANGNKKAGNGTANAAEGAAAPGKQAGEGQKVNAGEGKKNQAGEAAAKEGQPKAVGESEQFKDDAGITIGANGQVQNVGGNLGITKGSDGSTSVGGKSGINISAREDDGSDHSNEDGQQ
ncbi:hypothetical protein CGRA01v4_14383 [Colletotrichum graminicola]|uniref:Cell surface protein n=1 Tax=Colletotrichum graminicola (strain M1.001 / M2 / FGSC 10212) TaxID=645133 RepID=E3Q5K3_COLGM|nr:uncharacterized protein GLRG_01114 [Colletotrichum graminicola M1.001]EFQ25970.1 hypothetical protein GLRG_01114 [Colletotrichum graminicola M1.001]WDK23092.1 hypothetical protein CGRA01v4_14383 [Colletotrichum graminicola]